MELKKLTLYYRISFLGFLGAACMFSFIMMFIILTSESENAPKILSYIMAAMFWVFLLIGAIFVIIAGKKERQIYKQMQFDKIEKYNSQLLVGVFSFFKNKKSKAVDIVFIISLITTVIFYLIHINIPAIIIIMTTLVISSFILHSFWNGKIYKCIYYLKDQSKDEE